MAEYIERSLLMEWLTAAETQKRLRSSSGEEVYAEVLVMINNAPTADVVEVVRCKECKYGWTHIYQTSAPTLHCINVFCGKEVKSMDFCSYGKRRGGDADG